MAHYIPPGPIKGQLKPIQPTSSGVDTRSTFAVLRNVVYVSNTMQVIMPDVAAYPTLVDLFEAQLSNVKRYSFDIDDEVLMKAGDQKFELLLKMVGKEWGSIVNAHIPAERKGLGSNKAEFARSCIIGVSMDPDAKKHHFYVRIGYHPLDASKITSTDVTRVLAKYTEILDKLQKQNEETMKLEDSDLVNLIGEMQKLSMVHQKTTDQTVKDVTASRMKQKKEHIEDQKKIIKGFESRKQVMPVLIETMRELYRSFYDRVSVLICGACEEYDLWWKAVGFQFEPMSQVRLRGFPAKTNKQEMLNELRERLAAFLAYLSFERTVNKRSAADLGVDAGTVLPAIVTVTVTYETSTQTFLIMFNGGVINPTRLPSAAAAAAPAAPNLK